jgi:hypothetical protein
MPGQEISDAQRSRGAGALPESLSQAVSAAREFPPVSQAF